jgi:glycosyltransferase involved in cell wall biosynthesis
VTGPEPLIIATQASGSGLGRFAVELANALAAAGHPVTMVAPAQPYPLAAMRHVIVASPQARGGWRKLVALACQSLAVAAAVLRVAGPGRPVLLIHLAPSLPVSLAPIVAARLKRARLALSLHDFYPHAAHFPAPLHGLERWLYRLAYRRCTLVIAHTKAQSQRLVNEAGVPARRVRTLFHGPFVLPGLAPAGPRAELLLLVFGSLRPNKRVLESICAVRQLRGEGCQVGLRVAGAARPEDAAYWARCCAEIPPGDPGFDIQPRFFDEDELAGVLAGVDAMLCPYAGFDSQSGVAVTAVSNGIPVIATAAAQVAPVDLAAAPWPQVAPGADAGAIAAAVRGFIAIPAPARLAFAAALQRRFLAAAGWATLAERHGAAMRELEFWP